MCLKCQKCYCKRCINKFNKNDENNPHKCEEPDYINSLEKNNILSILKFFCAECKEQINYSEVERHHQTCCPGKISDEMIFRNKAKIKRLTSAEVENLLKKGNKVTNIKCK